MHLFLIFCLLLYSHSALSNVCDTSDSEQRGKCTRALTDIRNSEGFGHLKSCDCGEGLPNLGILCDCVKSACVSHCENSVSQKMFGCEEVKGAVQRNCKGKCGNSYLYVIEDDAEAKQACTDKNKAILKNQLTNYCNATRVQAISNLRPGKLICPEGDASNTKCGEFCDGQIKGYLKNIQQICGDITTKSGFGDCQGALQSQVDQNLPTNPDQLIRQGFSWQKCAFGMPCAQEIESAFNTVLQQCNNLKAKATLCCDDPVKCVDAGKANQALFSDLSSAPTGMAEKCRLIKETFGEVGNVGQKMASQCREKASACVQGCGEQITNNFRNKFHQICTFDIMKEETYNRATHTCSPDLVNTYVKKYKGELATLVAQCEVEGQKSNNLAQSADEVLKSALSGAQCEEQAQGGVDIPSAPQPGAGQTGFSSGAAGATTSSITAEPTLTWRDPGKKDKPMSGSEGGGASSSRDAAGGLSENIEGSQPGLEGGTRHSNKKGTSEKDKNVIGGGGAGSVAGGVGQKLQGPAGKLKKPGDKSGKTKEGAEEEIDKLSQRQFAKTGSGDQNSGVPSWTKIKPRQNLNTRISAFGSPHDDIFKRISDRITLLCRQEKLHCP